MPLDLFLIYNITPLYTDTTEVKQINERKQAEVENEHKKQKEKNMAQ